MSLANYKPATESIAIGEGHVLTVRGLSLDDLGALMKDHLEDLDKLVRLVKEPAMTNEMLADGTATAIRLVSEAPVFVAQAIAIAANEPDLVGVARTMTAPLQIEIMKAIYHLTFKDAGGLKKFVEGLLLARAKTVRTSLSDSHI